MLLLERAKAALEAQVAELLADASAAGAADAVQAADAADLRERLQVRRKPYHMA